MPPPEGTDLAALLYLNPQLAAQHGVTSVEAALLNYDALCSGLPSKLPCELPSGFDAGVYLATACPAPSAVAATLRAAAAAETGAPPPAAGGEFVGSLMRRCSRAAASSAWTVPSPALGDDGLLRVGDEVRLVPLTAQGCGEALEATVLSKTADAAGGTALGLALPPSRLLLLDGGDGGSQQEWLLVGIRVPDVRRAALSELARRAIGLPDALSGVVDAAFDQEVYCAAYPAARLLRTREEAFLSQRAMWQRGEEYRVSRGADAANVRAPLVRFDGAIGVGLSNMPGPAAGGSASTRLAVDGDVFTTGTVLTLSDAGAKNGIERISGALERVRALRGYTFFSAAASAAAAAPRRHTGLLAHEVHAALPEAVYEGADGVKAVAYGNLAGLLVEAINALADGIAAERGIARVEG
jgi:Chaperone of endosialidase